MYSAYLSRIERADERTRTAYSCSTYKFACVRSSAFYHVRELRLFRRFSMIWGFALSIVYQCVSARLQYGLQYMSGRDEVMRQWSMFKIPYIDPRPNM